MKANRFSLRLKPCPFCGAQMKLVFQEPAGVYRIVHPYTPADDWCPLCTLSVGSDPHGLAQAWNTRCADTGESNERPP